MHKSFKVEIILNISILEISLNLYLSLCFKLYFKIYLHEKKRTDKLFHKNL